MSPRVWWLVLFLGSAFALIAASTSASFAMDIPPGQFLRDPMSTMKGHPLTGFQSHLGVLLMTATSAVCLFTCLVLRCRRDHRDVGRFLGLAGAFTLVLAFDDLFMFHEDLAERFLGLDEQHVFLGFGLFFAWLIVSFRALILSSDYLLLVVTMICFAMMLLIDFELQPRWNSQWRIIMEDSAKLLGMAAWSGHFTRVALEAMLYPRDIGANGRDAKCPHRAPGAASDSFK